MATIIKDSLTDHSPLDGTNDAINGAEVDANTDVISQILDGTTATDLATDSTVDFRFTSSRAGLRLIDTDNAGGAVHYGLDMEWDPGDGGQMTDGSSGVGMRFIMPDAADTQTAYARMYVLMRDDTADSDDAEFVFEAAVGGTLTTELLHMSQTNGIVFNDDSGDIDFRIEGANTANGFLLDAGQDAISLGGANVDGAAFTLNNLQSRTAITSVGSQLHIPAQTTNFDNSSGTIAIGAAMFIGIPTWTNASSALTITHSASLYIQGVPVDSTNVTATNTPYALWVDAGATQLDGAVTVGGNLSVGGDFDVTGSFDMSDADITNIGSIALDTITNDGTDITLDSSGDIVIDAAGGNIEFKDAGTLQFTIDMDGTSGAQVIKLGVDSDDLIFQQYDGNEVVRIADDRRLYFYDKGGEYIYSDGTDLHIVSGADINLPASIGLTFGDDGEKIEGDGTNLTIASSALLTLTAGGNTVITNNALVSGTLTSTGILSVDSTTESTSTTTGSIHTDGGIGWAKDAYVGDDMFFSSAAVIDWGGGDVTLTHTVGCILTFAGGVINLGANAGAGIAHTDGTFHVHTATAGGSVTAEVSADDLVVENNTNCGISILCPANAQGNITFGDANLNLQGLIGYNHTGDYMEFRVSATEVLRMTTSVATLKIPLTVGVNDAGHDVKFFGATSGAYMLWDESADDLVLAGAAGLDIAGNIDVDGTTNLDAVDIDGAVQIDGTVTVGANTDGYDVKFFGNASGSYWLWDESADGVVQIGTLTVGVDDAGHDVKFFGDAADAYMLWDTSRDDLILGGAAQLGIGTTNPAYTFHVVSTTDGDFAAKIRNSLSTNGNGLLVNGADDSTTFALRVMDHDGGTDLLTVRGSGLVGIGDHTNANMTKGLTINGAASGNQNFTIKGTFTTGLTTLPSGVWDIETDDIYAVGPGDADEGGVRIIVASESSIAQPLITEVWGGTPSTTDTSSSVGAVHFKIGEHNGSNVDVDMAANSNLFTIAEIDSSNNSLTRMLLKADDGELHLGNSTLVALDAEEDALIVRAMQRESSHGGILDNQWDNPFYNYDKLKEFGLAGEKDKDDFFLFPLQSRLNAHEGAIWQTYCGLRDIQEVVDYQQEEIESLKKELRLLKG